MNPGMWWLAAGLGVAAAVLLGGADERVEAQKKFQLVLFTKNLSNPYWNGVRVGADKAGRALGAEIHHAGPTKTGSIEEQMRLVEDWIVKKPDAFVVVPVDDKALVPSIEEVNKAGIPVVNVSTRLAGGNYVTYVGSDDETIGYEMAKYTFKAMGNKGKVIYIEGASAAITQQNWKKGVARALKETSGIKPVAFANYRRRSAVQVMETLLRRFPEVDAVICADDDTALGVVQALEAAGRAGTTKVVGIGAIPEAAEAILKGPLLASADLSGHDLGYLAVTAAIKHLKGETVPKNIILPVVIVDKSNAQTWALAMEDKPVPDWNKMVSIQK